MISKYCTTKTFLKIFILILCFSAFNSIAQDSFSYVFTNLKLKQGATNLDSNAVIGGLNTPQFGTMDLNQDGKSDLVIFDRSQNRYFTFINNGLTTKSYKYEPYYESFLPEVFAVMLIRDFDRDGKKDIMGSSGNQDFVMYKNITTSSDKGPKFKKLYDNYYKNNFYIDTYNELTARNADYPIVGDMDNDGDLDILKYEAGFGTIGYYVNKEVEHSYTNGDSLLLEYSDICWGSFQEKTDANDILIGACGVNKKYRHLGGSSLLEYDFDNDGDVDILMANSGYNDVVYIENGKSDFSYPYDTAISATNNFPSASPIDVTTYPHLFLEDLNNDGKLDLIAAPGANVDYQDLQNIHFYSNTGTNLLPTFGTPNKDFLTNEFIDHGSSASPVLWDEDNDGDLDLFIAATGNYSTTTHLADRIFYYENKNGVFELSSSDYANISSKNFLDLTITFGDVNNDSKIDLVYGLRDGSVGWFENKGTLGNPSFPTSLEIFPTSISNASAKPAMYDINGDNKEDLIVGYFKGNISYYENTGSNNFNLVTDSFGRIITNYLDYSFDPPIYSYEGYASPEIKDINNDGIPELITGAVDGKIKVYSIDVNNPNDLFTEYKSPLLTQLNKDTMSYHYCGNNSIPTIGDINNDSIYDLIVGTAAGGIKSFLGIPSNNLKTISIDKITKDNFNIYPNPSNGTLSVELKNLFGSYNIQVINALGKVVLQETFNTANNLIDLKGNNLSDGFYTLKLTSLESNYSISSKFILLQD